jgi:hypothetical protein
LWAGNGLDRSTPDRHGCGVGYGAFLPVTPCVLALGWFAVGLLVSTVDLGLAL